MRHRLPVAALALAAAFALQACDARPAETDDRDVTCAAGRPCTCTGERCTMACPADGACEVRCDGAVCVVDCAEGQPCALSCFNGSSCRMNCASGPCDVLATSAGAMRQYCNASEACTALCTGGGACTQDVAASTSHSCNGCR